MGLLNLFRLSKYISCPACNEGVHEEAKRCPHCTSDFVRVKKTVWMVSGPVRALYTAAVGALLGLILAAIVSQILDGALNIKRAPGETPFYFNLIIIVFGLFAAYRGWKLGSTTLSVRPRDQLSKAA